MQDVSAYGMMVMEIMNNSGWERDFDDAEIEFIVHAYQHGATLEQCIGHLDKTQRHIEQFRRIEDMHERIDAQLKRAA